MKQAGTGQTGLRIAAGVAVVFGMLTIVSGGRALFGGPEASAALGDAVPFVLWFNTLAGFAYFAAGIGLFARKRWAVWLSMAILLATVVVFAAFGLHVFQGGAYETRTLGAMTLRAAVWLAIAAVAFSAMGRE